MATISKLYIYFFESQIFRYMGSSHPKIRKAIILAAGCGRRLLPFTKEVPKCMVKIGGKPILFYQLRALARNGINEVVIITGHGASHLKQYVKKNFSSLKISFVYNPQYENTDCIYSMYCAKKHLTGNFLVLDGDILFHPRVIYTLNSAPLNNSRTAIRKVNCGPEEMKVFMDKSGRIKKIRKTLGQSETSGEFLGITAYLEDFARHLPSAIKNTINYAGKNQYETAAVERIIKEYNGVLRGVDITAYPAIEIDTPEDLTYAEKNILPQIISEF